MIFGTKIVNIIIKGKKFFNKKRKKNENSI